MEAPTGSLSLENGVVFWVTVPQYNSTTPIIYTATTGSNSTLLDFTRQMTLSGMVIPGLYQTSNPIDILNTGKYAIFQIIVGEENGTALPQSQTLIYLTNGSSVSLLWDLQNSRGMTTLPTPVVAAGTPTSLLAGTSAAISGLAVLQYTGTALITVTLQSTLGTLTTTGGAGTITGNGSANPQLVGTLSQVNNDLGSLAFAAGHTTGAGTITIVAKFNSVSSANEITNISITAQAPTLTSQTANQTWTEGQTLSFKLAANTFTDPQNETLTYAATLTGGAALPSWLSFNVGTQTFSGLVPATPESLVINVTATDSSNLSASETFIATIPAVAPVVSNPTTNQTWNEGENLSLQLPSNTFGDPQGEGLTYSAALASGGALPSWLSFNPSTDTFNGTVPNSPQSFTIMVTATDTSGLSASETFVANVVATPTPTGLSLSASSDSGVKGDSVTDVTTPTIIGFGAPGDIVTLDDGATAVGTGVVGNDGDWAIVTTRPLSLGAHSLTATEAGAGGGNDSVSSSPLALSIVQSPATADFTSGGASDLLWQSSTGAVAVWLMNGMTPTSKVLVQTPPPSWHAVGTGDFDGDGKSDILWQYNNAANAADPSNGAVGIWLMNGTTPVSEVIVQTPPPSWHAIGTGDFDGDGKSDILWQYNNASSPADPDNGDVAVWLMNGTTPTSQVIVQTPLPSWHAVGTGDFNGDGKSDILFQNTNGGLGIWEMNGVSIAATGFPANSDLSWHVLT